MNNNFKNNLTPMCALSMWGPSSVSSEAVMQLWDKLCKQVFLDRMALLALFLGWLKNLANLNIAKEAKFKSFFFFTCQHVKINPKKMLLALFLGWPKRVICRTVCCILIMKVFYNDLFWQSNGTKLAIWSEASQLGPNVSTTPLWQWGFWQCLPFSSTTLRGKHCRHHCRNGSCR